MGAAASGSASASSFVAGVQAGYNYQIGRLLLGLEADYGRLSLKGSRQAAGAYPVGFSFLVSAGDKFAVTSSFSTDWLITARGRIGWTFTNLLAYATAGLAVTEINSSHSFSDAKSPSAIGNWNASERAYGTALGGGLEWAFKPNWTVKAEYLYLKFSSVLGSGKIQGRLGYSNAISTAVDLEAQVARLGMNYKF